MDVLHSTAAAVRYQPNLVSRIGVLVSISLCLNLGVATAGMKANAPVPTPEAPNKIEPASEINRSRMAEWEHAHHAAELGDLDFSEGKYITAGRYYQEAISIIEKLLLLEPLNTEWLLGLWVSASKLGEAHAAEDKHQEALQAFKKSKDAMGRLARENPSNVKLQLLFVESYQRIGYLQLEQHEVEQAKPNTTGLPRFKFMFNASESFRIAHHVMERLAKSYPHDSEVQIEYASSCWSTAVIHLKTHFDDAAIALLKDGLSILKKLEKTGQLDAEQKELAGEFESLLSKLDR